jgi:hypothetical protein
MKIAAASMVVFCGALAFLPMEEDENIKKDSVACTAPLLQYQLGDPQKT